MSLHQPKEQQKERKLTFALCDRGSTDNCTGDTATCVRNVRLEVPKRGKVLLMTKQKAAVPSKGARAVSRPSEQLLFVCMPGCPEGWKDTTMAW